MSDDDVRGSLLHAGQVLSHMDLVDHHLHVNAVAGIRIDILRRVVAHDAQLDFGTGSAMKSQSIGRTLLQVAVAVMSRITGSAESEGTMSWNSFTT